MVELAEVAAQPPRRHRDMSESSKVTAAHLRRQAFVYPRQSSQGQVERHPSRPRVSTRSLERAIELGFTREQVVVIDDDLGISGDGTVGAVGVSAPGGGGRARPCRTGARP